MNVSFALALSAGLFVGNGLIGYFVREMSPLEAVGFGALTAAIGALLSFAVIMMK